jgi:ABC-type sugar transport system ATPase subunit
MEKMGVYVDPSRLVAELPTATRTVLAIAAALARSARILVLDEPTATLGANDVQVLFGVYASSVKLATRRFCEPPSR